MTQEEKQLLLKDLCARLPYGVRVDIPRDYPNNPQIMERIDKDCNIIINSMLEYSTFEYKPYLRPMSTMTEEEENELVKVAVIGGYKDSVFKSYLVDDWLNEHHFDYRGLIPKGLALEAKEGMYKTE